MKKVLVGLLAGLAMSVVGFLLNFVFAWIFPAFQAIYNNTDIFLPMAGGRGLLFFVYPFALGIGLAFLYEMLNKKAKQPFAFAGVYFFISAVPAFFINVGSFNLPVMMVVTWTIMSYINGLVAGLLFRKMLK